MMRFRMLPAICILIFGFICCHKDNNDSYKSRGRITGPDYRMCVCCGGWYIDIDNTTYEFDSLPVGSDIDLQKISFPVNVKLDWQLSDKLPCPDKRITIQRIILE